MALKGRAPWPFSRRLQANAAAAEAADAVAPVARMRPDQAPPMPRVIRPVPSQLSQGLPSSLPLPWHCGQMC